MIMEVRQSGAPLSSFIAAINKKSSDPAIVEPIRAAAIEAYRVPVFNLPENRANAIAEFRNEIEVSCYERMQR